MAQKAETVFRKKVVLFLKEEFEAIKIFSIQQVAIRGTPDLLICLNGQFIALELKSKKKDPDPLQIKNLKEVEAAGGISIVCYPENFEEVKTFLKVFNETTINRRR